MISCQTGQEDNSQPCGTSCAPGKPQDTHHLSDFEWLDKKQIPQRSVASCWWSHPPMVFIITIFLMKYSMQARLMSLTPLALQTAFTQIHKKRVPDIKRRGRLFEAAILRLVQWWTDNFFDVEPRGSGEIQSRTFDEVTAEHLRKSAPF